MSTTKTLPLPHLPIVLLNNHNNRTTVVYGGCISNGSQFFAGKHKEFMFDKLSVSNKNRASINRALKTNLKKIDACLGKDDLALTQFATAYFNKVGKDHTLKNILLQTDDLEAIAAVFDVFGLDKDVKNKVIELANADLTYRLMFTQNKARNNDMALIDFVIEYFNTVGKDTALKQRILQTDDADAIGVLIDVFGFTSAIKDKVIQSKSPALAYQVLRRTGIKDKPEMRQVIVDADDPQWALNYCLFFGKDPDMRQIVLKSGKLELIYSYYSKVDSDQQLCQAIVDSHNPYWAYQIYSNHHISDKMIAKQLYSTVKNSDSSNLVYSLERFCSAP